MNRCVATGSWIVRRRRRRRRRLGLPLDDLAAGEAQRDGQQRRSGGRRTTDSWRHYYHWRHRPIRRHRRLQQHRAVRQFVAVRCREMARDQRARRPGSLRRRPAALRRVRTIAPCGGTLRAHSCALTRPLKPRSATISTSRSAHEHIDQHAVVRVGVPHAEPRERLQRLLARRDAAHQVERARRLASTAKRISPPWPRSVSAIACSMAWSVAASKARRRLQPGVERDVAKRALHDAHQRPDAPPPPKPPPPPLQPPPPPPPQPPPPTATAPAAADIRPSRADPDSSSRRRRRRRAARSRTRCTAAPIAMTSVLVRNQTIDAAMPRGHRRAAERCRACRRRMPLPTNTNISSTGSAVPKPSPLGAPRWPRARLRQRLAFDQRDDARRRPRVMPPKKSPLRKRGTMTCSMMRFASTSGSAPSRP